MLGGWKWPFAELSMLGKKIADVYQHQRTVKIVKCHGICYMLSKLAHFWFESLVRKETVWNG